MTTSKTNRKTTETVNPIGRKIRNSLNGQIGVLVRVESSWPDSATVFYHVKCADKTWRLPASKVEWA